MFVAHFTSNYAFKNANIKSLDNSSWRITAIVSHITIANNSKYLENNFFCKRFKYKSTSILLKSVMLSSSKFL